MKNIKQKKVAAIHDLSGYGRCSLTVIIPVLSAMGIQVCPVPTAILSTHTGGFGDVVFKDLSSYTIPCFNHYKSLGIEFDMIYSGFLASSEQIDHCIEFFNGYPGALKLVDPVMGDYGKPYRTYTKELCARMGELASAADIITPNLTEASILLGESYPNQLTRTEIKSWLARLSEKTKVVVITGVPLAEGVIANVGADRETGGYWQVDCEYVPVNYPGTGDLFATVLTGALLNNDSLPIAMNKAENFTRLAIKTTYSYNSEPREGVMFEKVLPSLYLGIGMEQGKFKKL